MVHRDVYRDLPDQPRVTLYHGTPIPIEVVKTKGLQAHNMERIKEFILSRVRNPIEVIEDLKKVPDEPPFGGEWGIVKLTAYKQDARDYSGGLPEIIAHALSLGLPPEKFKEIILTLVEIRGDFFVGKLVTVSIPTSWLSYLNSVRGDTYDPLDKETLWEVAIPWDISPKYITKIQVVVGEKWEKYLEEEITMLYYEE